MERVARIPARVAIWYLRRTWPDSVYTVHYGLTTSTGRRYVTKWSEHSNWRDMKLAVGYHRNMGYEVFEVTAKPDLPTETVYYLGR
jgi:hypothetical protein